MVGQRVPDTVSAAYPTATENGRVLAGACVVPAPMTHLPSKLNERTSSGVCISPYLLREDGLCGRDVRSVTAVAGHRDGLLRPVELIRQILSKDLHRDGLHHAPPVAEDIAAEAVDELVT